MPSVLPSNHYRVAVWSIPSTVLLMWPGMSDPINFPKLLILLACAFTSFVLFVLDALSRNRSVSVGSPVLVVLYFACGATMIVTALFSTPNFARLMFGSPGRNNGLLFYLSMLILAVVILMTPLNRVHLLYLIRWFSLTAIIFGVYCALQFLNLDPVSWNISFNRVIGSLGNPNFSAAMLGVSSVYFAFLAISSSKNSRSKRFGFWTWAFLLGFLAWTTESFQGVMIAFTGLVIIFVIKLNSYLTSKFSSYLALFSVASLFILLFVSFMGFGPLGTSLEQYTLRLRSVYAYYGLRAMLENPLSGVGVDSYYLAFRKYRSKEFIEEFGISLNVDNAHSAPFQVGASFGVVVFVIYVLIQIYILFRVLRIIASADSQNNELTAISIVWVLLFLQSLLSLEIIGLAVLMSTLGAFIISFSRQFENAQTQKSNKDRSLENHPEWNTAAMFVSICISMIPFIYFSRQDAAFQYLKAASSIENVDFAKTQNEFEKLGPLSLFEPVKVAQLLPGFPKLGLRDETSLIVARVYEANPKDPVATELKAVELATRGLINEAIAVRRNLRIIDPLNYRYELTLAKLLARTGKNVELKQSIDRVLSLAPMDSAEFQEAKKLESEFLSP